MIRFAANLARRQPIEVHRGAARGWLHISDAVRAIEAATRVPEYAVVNIGHPDIVPMDKLAERIRAAFDAPASLIVEREIRERMTLVKRPSLERQRVLLGIEPAVSLEEGVARVCRRVRERLAAGEQVHDEN